MSANSSAKKDCEAIKGPAVIENGTGSGTIASYLTHARQFSSGERKYAAVLRERPDSATVRVNIPGQESVIMKFWERPGWRAIVRRATRTTPAWREWTALTRLEIANVPVARPLARFSLGDPEGRFSDVLVIKDLGAVSTALDRIKHALTAGCLADAVSIDDQMIDITAGMVAARVLDSDHSLVNCLGTDDGRVFRVDLEVARVVWTVGSRPGLYAQMIARLLTSYVYAVQPDLDRAAEFGLRISECLKVPQSVLRRAKAIIDGNLERQKTTVGVDSRLSMKW